MPYCLLSRELFCRMYSSSSSSGYKSTLSSRLIFTDSVAAPSGRAWKQSTRSTDLFPGRVSFSYDFCHLCFTTVIRRRRLSSFPALRTSFVDLEMCSLRCNSPYSLKPFLSNTFLANTFFANTVLANAFLANTFLPNTFLANIK